MIFGNIVSEKIFHWVGIINAISDTPKMLWFMILEDVEASKQRV